MKSRYLLAFLSWLALTQSTVAALSIVAKSGQLAPGTTGTFEQTFWLGSNAMPPSLGGGGHVAFAASLLNGQGNVSSATDNGIWAGRENSLSLIAREGFSAPGAPSGALFRRVTNPIVNRSGAVAFSGLLRENVAGVTLDTNTGVWSSGEGALTMLARKGSQAPGTAPGVNFLTFGEPNLSDSGGTLFAGTLSGPGVTAENDKGIWASRAGELKLVARMGSPAPGMPAGLTFSKYSFPITPSISAAGHVSFHAKLAGPGVNLSNDFTIWSERNGQLTLLAREGDQAPGFPIGTTYSFDMTDVHFNRSGRYAVKAFASSQEHAIFAESDGALHRIAKQGDAVPGASSESIFSSFFDVLSNSAGDVAFSGSYQPYHGTNHEGVWVKSEGEIRSVALRGNIVPGASDYSFFGFRELALNEAGQVAFVAELRNLDWQKPSKLGLFATTVGGELRQIALLGNALSPAYPSPPSFDFNGLAGNTSHRPGLNDRGEVAFIAYSDGVSHIVVSDAVAQNHSDFNGDGDVDGDDFLAWQRGRGKTTGALPADGDADRDGDVDAADLAAWRSAFGGANSASAMAAVPEPATGALVVIGAVGLLVGARRSAAVKACFSEAYRPSSRVGSVIPSGARDLVALNELPDSSLRSE